MTKETLRMQMLSGVITEGQYKSKLEELNSTEEKDSLNEGMIGGIVGIGAINQIPPRAKTDYETAFEHFLGARYELNEEVDEVEVEDDEALQDVSLDEGEEEYNQIVDNLLDNFDDSREASAGIDKLKKMGMWDEFLKSDKGATFQKLRKSLR